MVDISHKTGNAGLLEAPVVLDSNNQFHMISEAVKREVDVLDEKMIFERWFDWFKASYIRKPGLA